MAKTKNIYFIDSTEIMLSYQHSYHAGSRADVHKHAALAVILAKLAAKDKPLHYLETHAGQGVYDLTSEAAQKTQEATCGIIPLLASKLLPVEHPYSHAIDSTKSLYGENYYPGSPLIAKILLKETDHIHLMELHPQEHAALKKNLRGHNIHVHKRDGYEGILALAPPKPRRGLVLIDPSYEVKTEYNQAATFVLKLHQKWPEAVILLWYPILDAGYHVAMYNALKQAALPKFWQQEIIFIHEQEARIRGSGLICINLPFGLENELEKIKTLIT